MDQSGNIELASNKFSQGDLNGGVALLKSGFSSGDLDAGYLLCKILFNEGFFEQGLITLQQLKVAGYADAVVDYAFYLWLVDKDSNALGLAIKKHPENYYVQLLSQLSLSDKIFDILDIKTSLLSSEPEIKLFNNAVPNALIMMLISIFESRVEPSMIYDPVTGRQQKNSIRNNESTNFSVAMPSVFLSIVIMFLSRFAGESPENAEYPMIMKYTAGTKFSAHVDYLSESQIKSNLAENEMGQRVKTLLLYLNDDFDGGETAFINQNIVIPPKKGSVLTFDNVSNGVPNKNSKHEGRVVTNKEKWLLSIWFRENSIYRSNLNNV